MLLDRPGEVVTREAIRQKLWPNDTIVEFDHSINAAIKKLRSALGDSAEEPRFVETVARRGYRLLVLVEREEAKSAGPAVTPDTPTETESVGNLIGKSLTLPHPGRAGRRRDGWCTGQRPQVRSSCVEVLAGGVGTGREAWGV
jgi:DNA-binding winged helix-turn-helix (wHTH) protein